MTKPTKVLLGVFVATVGGAVLQFATKGQYPGALAAWYILGAGTSGGALVGLLWPTKKKTAVETAAQRAIDDLDTCLRSLEVELAEAPEEVQLQISVATLFTSAQRLRDREESARALVASVDLHLLRYKLTSARNAREKAGIEAHIRAAEEAEASLAEAIARKRALLHEVNALRAQLTTQSIDRALIDDACTRLSQIARKQSA